MKRTIWMAMAMLALTGCGKGQEPTVQAPHEAKVAEHVDYRQLAMLTMTTVGRSAELFSKLGNSDQVIYQREVYNPAVDSASAWPLYYAPEGKNVPEALWNCHEAATAWVSYLDRATMKNPPAVAVADAKKDLIRVQEKTRLCDAAINRTNP